MQSQFIGLPTHNDIFGGVVGVLFFIAYLLIALTPYIFVSYMQYQACKKLGISNPWISYVPVLSWIKNLQIAGMSGWLFLLYIIPVVNIIIYAIMCNNMRKKLGGNHSIWTWILFIGFYMGFPTLAYSYTKEKDVTSNE